ncbi:hypothetical protein ACET3Z_027967 [Daucus carota]
MSRNSGVTLSEVLPASSQPYAESGYPHHPSAETQTFPKTKVPDIGINDIYGEQFLSTIPHTGDSTDDYKES